ncbi:MAG TPA: hypothetical protein VFP43_15960 [Mesorhizobium sp.]|nr:hypothetical protein [Mesorhizobium sp.]
MSHREPTQSTLADKPLMPLTTLKRLVYESARDQIRRALEDNGIVFLVSDQGEGVMFVRRDAQARPNGAR